MSKAKTTQKTEVNPTSEVSTSSEPLQPISVEASSSSELKGLKTRIDALEAAIDSLVRDITRLKQVPIDLVTHQMIMDRHTERISSLDDFRHKYLLNMPSPKPKKRWGIF